MTVLGSPVPSPPRMLMVLAPPETEVQPSVYMQLTRQRYICPKFTHTCLGLASATGVRIRQVPLDHILKELSFLENFPRHTFIKNYNREV